MKDFLTKTSTTSVVAVITTLFAFALLFYLCVSERPTNDTRATQIITGTFAILSMVGGYYFGASKQRSSAINAETVNTVNTGSEQSDNNKPA